MADCSEVRAALLEGRDSFGPDLDGHVMRCPSCNELLVHDAALGRLLASVRHASPRIGEGDLAAAVARDLERDRGVLGRLRGLGTGKRIALAAAGAVLPVLVLSVGNPRALDPMRVFTAAYALLVVVAIASLLAPLSRMRRRARQIVTAALVFGVPTSLLVLVSRPNAPAEHATYSCFAVGMLSTAPVFALLHALARRPRFSFSELLLLGAATGVTANMSIGMYCLDHRLLHLLAGHALSGLIWIACSWLGLRLASQQA